MSEVARLPEREPPSLLNIIARAAHDPDFDVAKLRELLQMQRELISDERRLLFNTAMGECQAEMEPVARGAYNPQTQSRYAALPAIDRAIRPVYTKHGFALTFGTGTPSSPGYINVTCRVSHSAGHVEEYQLEGHPDTTGIGGRKNKTELHGLGSTISYLRRYLTVLVFNIAILTEDDDGNAGGGDIRNIADGARENIQRQPTERRLTAGEWLTKFALQCSLITNREDADRLITSEESLTMREIFTKASAEGRTEGLIRYNYIIGDMLQKWFNEPPADDTKPTDPAT